MEEKISKYKFGSIDKKMVEEEIPDEREKTEKRQCVGNPQ